jgi:hypothetical protein
MEKVKLFLKLTEEQQNGIREALGLGANEKVELLDVDLTENDLKNVKSTKEGTITIHESSKPGTGGPQQTNQHLWFEKLDGKLDTAPQTRMACCCLWVQQSAPDSNTPN